MTSPRTPRVLHLLALATLTLALLTAQEALVSQVHYQDVSLAEVLQRGPTIVHGQVADPATRRVELTYPTTDRAGEPVEGRYAFALQRVEVKEVLRGAGPSAGQIIEVYDPTLVDGFGLHLRYQSTGISKSPIYTRLDGGEVPWASRSEGLYLLQTGVVGRSSGGDEAAAWEALNEALAGALPLSISGGVVPLSRRAELEGPAGSPAKPASPAKPPPPPKPPPGG